MNKTLLAALTVIIGTSALGVAFAGSTLNSTTNSTSSGLMNVTLNSTVAASIASNTTSSNISVVDPQFTENGYLYVSSHDSTGLGVRSNTWYPSVTFDVISDTYFLFI